MTALACRSMPSDWSAAGFCGCRQPTGSSRSVRRNWPICSTGSTGGTPFALGDQRRLAEGCDALTHPLVEERPGPDSATEDEVAAGAAEPDPPTVTRLSPQKAGAGPVAGSPAA